MYRFCIGTAAETLVLQAVVVSEVSVATEMLVCFCSQCSSRNGSEGCGHFCSWCGRMWLFL